MDVVDKKMSSAETAQLFMKAMFSYYTGPLYRVIAENPQLQETIPGFLINPESISVYLGKSHIAIEYKYRCFGLKLHAHHRHQYLVIYLLKPKHCLRFFDKNY